MPTPRPLLLVANPSAGGGRTTRLLPAVERALVTAGHDVRIEHTRSLAHATELAAGGVADGRTVVSLGGDGLAGCLAGAVADAGGVLAVLPGGRGNDFCRAAGLPQDAVAACAVVTSGVERALDLGVVDDGSGPARFLGIAGIGFESAVQERVLTSTVPLGKLVYAWGALAVLARWRPATFTLQADGVAVQHRGWSVAVANSGVYGGGMRLAPQASMTDGLLDLVSIGDLPRRTFLAALPELFRGTHVRRPQVSVQQVRQVRLDADRPFRVFADGDPIAALPCTVSVLPGAVRVLLPA